MSIDINGVGSSQLPLKVTSKDENRPPEKRPENSEPDNTRHADTLSLSAGARQLGGVSPVASDTPVVDTERVEAMKAVIDSGDYEVDPARVASKLMQFESLLKSS